MNFQNLLSQLSKLKETPLGGLDSQFKMAPTVRKQYSLKHIEAQNPKESAVLALLYPDSNNQTYILLMLRASYDGAHSAQISFPGGKKELTDTDLKSTALRETKEEVGIPENDIYIVRELSKTYIPPSNFWVSPFLAICKKTPTFILNHEVEKSIEVAVSDLINDNSIISKKMSTSYMKNIDVPCFKLNNYIVWGATAMILSEIKDLIAER